MSSQLTHGAVEAMHKGQQIRTPLVQVIDVKKILGPNGQATSPERYRLVISDGIHFQQAMLATQLNELVNDGKLQPKCIVRLNEYICNTVHGRRIVIVLSIELTGPPLAQTIGTPQNIEDVGGGAAAPAPVAAAPARPAPQQQQSRPFQPQNTGRGGGGSGSSFGGPSPSLAEGTMPIKGLNPYQNRWTIKARITHKSDMRPFNNARGQSFLFSVDLLDAFGGEIRCTFFGEAATQWNDQIEAGQVFLIGRGSVKYANKRFSTLKNDYEISLDKNALIQPTEDDPSIPFYKFNFVDIADLGGHAKDETIDILGAVLESGAIQDIRTQAGNELQKRVVKVGDSSNAQVEVTLWGEQAAQWSGDRGLVVLFKGVKISDYNQRSLTVLRTSKLEFEPRIPEADRVREWFETAGQGEVASMSRNDFKGRGGGGEGGFGGGDKRPWDETRKSFAAVKQVAFGGQESVYFSVRATVTEIKHSRDHPPWYEACPTEKCNKKVTSVGGAYHCTKCGATHDHYKPRYVLSLNANDHSGSSWLTCFNDTASDVLNGTTADDLLEMLSRPQGESQYEDVFQKALFKSYNLRVRATQSEYEGENKVKLSVVKVIPMDYAKESKFLINSIAKYITA